MRKQWDAEDAQDEQDLVDGLIDFKEYNKRQRERAREEYEYHQETGRWD